MCRCLLHKNFLRRSVRETDDIDTTLSFFKLLTQRIVICRSIAVEFNWNKSRLNIVRYCAEVAPRTLSSVCVSTASGYVKGGRAYGRIIKDVAIAVICCGVCTQSSDACKAMAPIKRIVSDTGNRRRYYDTGKVDASRKHLLTYTGN